VVSEESRSRSSWRVVLALLIGIIPWSWTGSAHAAEAGAPQPATATPRLERWASLELALRTGFGIPFDEITSDAKEDLNDLVVGQVPIWVDVGARVGGHVSFGLYYSYGFGLPGSYLRETCDLLRATTPGASVDVSCYVRNHRLGLQLGYHFRPRDDFDPWIAGGVGHELLDVTISSAHSSGSATTTIDADGMEYLNVQAGLDYRLSQYFHAGPFLVVTVTTYGEHTRACYGTCGIAGSSGGEVQNEASHEWLFFGLRGVASF
jgi:hypothetical protein